MNMKKYQIIYADPPWEYNFAPTKSVAIETHYPTLTQDKIKNLQIPSADNSVLYLWATAPKLLEALEVMKAWGFTYKTQAIWDKGRTGMGYWFLGQHEILLVGTKGKFSPPEPALRKSSVIYEKRGTHSKKPTKIRELIHQWYPDKTKIELFARKPDLLFDADGYDGWDVWGDEVDSDIDLKVRK
ncbi:MAG: MT-A70 family methyltransferase [Candidatus Scalindua sp.]